MLFSAAPHAEEAPRSSAADPAEAARSQESGSDDAREAEVFFDELIPGQLREGHLAGAAVSVVNDGHMVFAKGYGYADREGRLLRAISS
jgi:CubicO group peptidase (beta-lactamase class C family)